MGQVPDGSAAELCTSLQNQADSLKSLDDKLDLVLLHAHARRVQALCEKQGVKSAKTRGVQPGYYDLPLERRMEILDAPSTAHLCKSIVMENKAWSGESGFGDPNNCRFYVIIVQYVAKLHSEKLAKLVRSWTPGAPGSKYNFQLTSSEVSYELTGYRHNAVVPVGMRVDIPIILSHQIKELSPSFLWLGGGHPDLKLGMPVQQLIDCLGARVADVTY
mmetsp:Transcript_30331/g.74539  ORF Transcript_30331/g.74539 Transcript_30331/m.74539 type:complete len:218 (+) Transcript_30331:120-773(+)